MPSEQQVVFIPDSLSLSSRSKTFTWEVLEDKRLKRLKISNIYSRHFNVTRTHRGNDSMVANQGSDIGTDIVETGSVGGSGFKSRKNRDVTGSSLEIGKKNSNSLAPFSTLSAKSTCGFYFSRSTVNNKMKIGIPPTNTVKWRTTSQPT